MENCKILSEKVNFCSCDVAIYFELTFGDKIQVCLHALT